MVLVEAQRIPEPATESDIMYEQLDYLIDHVASNASCGCRECQRYMRVRSDLLEIFAEPAASAEPPRTAGAAAA